MKQFAYLLILLLTSTQVDDAWVGAPASPSASLPLDDDEYLPAPRRPQERPPSYRQRPALGAVTLRQTGPPVAPRGEPSEWNLTTPFGPPPLYVFMSLQI
jgi:hypothetical protein